MKLKLFFLLFLLFSPLFLFRLHPPLSSADKKVPALIFSLDNQNDNYWYWSDVYLPLSSTLDLKVHASVANTPSGPAKIEIYQATLNDLLKLLVYDKDHKHIGQNIDYKKTKFISQLDVNLTDKDAVFSLPLPQSGLFLVRLVQGNLTSSLPPLIRSTFGSLARESKDSLIVWSQDFASQRSLAQGKVSLYDFRNQVRLVDSAPIDNDGITSFSLSQARQSDITVVESSDSFNIIPHNMPFLNEEGWLTFSPQTKTNRYFIFTDRPIYKPGDTVRFKAIVRDDDDSRYSPAQGSIHVVAGKAWEEKQIVYQSDLSIDSNSSIYSSFTLPQNVTTGEYSIRLSQPNVSSTSESNRWSDNYSNVIYFKVENYRKPEYSIEAEASQIDIIRGDSLNVTVKGQYYSGQPLSNVKVDYIIYSGNSYYYDYDYYYPDDGNRYYRAWDSAQVDSGSINLDSKGQGQLNYSTAQLKTEGHHQTLFVEFKYIDPSGNPSSTGVNAFIRSGEYSLYRDPSSPWGSKPNETINLPFILKANRTGLSLTPTVKFTVTRKWWEKYQDPKEKYPRYKDMSEQISQFDLKPSTDGTLNYSFNPTKEGSYVFDTIITDTRGNTITKSFYFWVSGGYAPYNTDSTSNIRIVTDKNKYLPGDTALVSINSDIPNRDILLSVNRGYQDRYEVVRLEGKEKTIPVKLFSQDLPNIFLVAKSFNTSSLTLDSDTKNISLDTNTKKIFYQISTNKSTYAPGDEVIVNITAKDVAGNPVESSLALWSVDKSIFALADKNYGDVFTTYWQERYLGTAEANSFQTIMQSNGAEMGGCFLPDTLITLSDGTKKSIQDISVGDKILTFQNNPQSGLIQSKVTATHQTKIAGYMVINTNLQLTPNHKVFLNDLWSEARNIKIGDFLTNQSGQPIPVTSVEYLNLTSIVYNLTTTSHTFLANGYWVHNEKGAAGTRDQFADTAYWNPSINTGKSGNVQLKFRLPDNLTTWVITALGASSDTKAGQAFTEIKVSKDLVIRPVLPNILHNGDSITISALVHNYTDLESSVTAKLTTDAGSLQGSPTTSLKLAPNSFDQVSWPIVVSDQKSTAKFEFNLSDNTNRSDIIVQTLPIRTLGVWQQQSDYKVDTSQFALQTPPNFDPAKSTITFNISTSILGSLPTAMEYLINYPYGCIEQTTSGLAPKLIAKKYPSIFAAAISKQTDQHPISEGLKRLSELQNSEGSWSWWYGKADNYVTAYVFKLLSQAKDLGLEIDQQMYDRAFYYLTRIYESASTEDKVFVAYALSFGPDKDRKIIPFNSLNQLDSQSLALAVMANLRGGQKDPETSGLNLLINRKVESPLGVYWPSGNSQSRFASVDASTGLAIQALNYAGSQNELIIKAANYLVQNRHRNYWSSTYATSQILLALSEFSQSQSESATDLTYTVKLDNATLSTKKVTGLQTQPFIVNIDVNKLTSNHILSVEKVGQGQIYTELNQKWWLKTTQAPPVSNGIKITKRFVNAKGEGYNFVPGDLVDVYLNIESQYSDYAVIEDHLPSGLIPVNTHLKNEQDYADSYYYYDSKEFLDDGIIIPVYDFESKTFTYQARVVNAGEFTVSPAFVTLMYQPDIWARSEFTKLSVDNQVTYNPPPTPTKRKSLPSSGSESASPTTKNETNIGLFVIFALILFTVIKNAQKPKTPTSSSAPPVSKS